MQSVRENTESRCNEGKRRGRKEMEGGRKVGVVSYDRDSNVDVCLSQQQQTEYLTDLVQVRKKHSYWRKKGDTKAWKKNPGISIGWKERMEKKKKTCGKGRVHSGVLITRQANCFVFFFITADAGRLQTVFFYSRMLLEIYLAKWITTLDKPLAQ